MSGFLVDVSKKSCAILSDNGLNCFEKLLYICLQQFTSKTGRAFPSHQLLANCLSISNRAVSRSIQGLKSKGFLEVKSQENGLKFYFLKSPQLTPASPLFTPRMTQKTPRMTQKTPVSPVEQNCININNISADITNTHTVNKQSFFCFVCFNIFSEKSGKCSVCSERYNIQIENLLIDINILKSLIRKYGYKKVYTTIDVIGHQYQDREHNIGSYPALLIGMLKGNIVLPKGYIPTHEKKSIIEEKKIFDKKKKELKLRQENDNKAYYEEAERRFNLLSGDAKEDVVLKAKEGLNEYQRKIKSVVEIEVYRILMEQNENSL